MTDRNKDKRTSKKLKILSVFVFCIVLALATALACFFGISPSKKVSVDDVESGEVSTSTSATYSSAGTYNFYSSTGTIGNNKAGKLVNGDILNFNYCGGVYTVTLPHGQYTLQVWGAEGGGSRLSGNSASGLGGYGGTSVGTLKITGTSMTLYICIGGYGRSSDNGNAAGGYNGGGQGYGSSTSEPGNGGGGATHIATGSSNRGELRNYSSYKTDVIMVAGGGGGGGEDTGDWYGHGGGTTGVDGTSSNAAGHGTQSGAGTGGGFGYGGGTNYGDGGGGGGGWYGGGTTTSASTGGDTQGGGGGSGYVNTSYLTGASTTTSSQTGNGTARINVINVNNDPRALTNTINNATLGGSA
ncbi:MAG: hypothetical protein J1G04_05145, partial [Clostridiales bacterium]|nr:hypothetical protein [Clostridiales bacterium]